MTMTMTMTIAMNHPLIKGTDMITKLDPTTAPITYVVGGWYIYQMIQTSNIATFGNSRKPMHF
jgi:hypothetical protein